MKLKTYSKINQGRRGFQGYPSEDEEEGDAGEGEGRKNEGGRGERGGIARQGQVALQEKSLVGRKSPIYCTVGQTPLGSSYSVSAYHFVAARISPAESAEREQKMEK
jgi:ribosomal protein L15